jgi:hypothetical protein
MTPSELDHPSGVPEKNEIEIPNDPSFVAACIASIADDAERLGWRLGNSILTWHHHWGLVWRVDILTRHDSVQRASRYICWRPPDMEDGIGGTALIYVKEADRIK